MFLLGDQFFPNQDGVVCTFFLNKYIFIQEKNECREISWLFWICKWIVSPKAVDGYVVSFVVSKYVNTNISKYFVFVD